MSSVIRKISIGSDYKTDAMHYSVGQSVYGGHTISHIIADQKDNSYNIFIKKFIFIYTMTLPLGLATTFEYWAIPISLFILYILASLELLAEEIEDPFGEDTNDLPVNDICVTIKKNVEEILN